MVNMFDHLWAITNVLATGQAITLYSHQTLTRVVCESAARIGYVLDPKSGYDGRIVRSSVLILNDADSRITATREVHDMKPHLIGDGLPKAIEAREKLIRQFKRAGIVIQPDKKGKPGRLSLSESANCNLNLTSLIGEQFPERPGIYRASSGIVHSNPWALDDAVDQSAPDDNYLHLKPDLPGIAASAIDAIDASMVVIERYAWFYGHDPASALRSSRMRIGMLDAHILSWYGRA